MLGGKSMLWEKIEQGTSGGDGRPCGLHSELYVKEIKISVLLLWGSCSLAEPELLSWLLLKIWHELKLKCMLVFLWSSPLHPYPSTICPGPSPSVVSPAKEKWGVSDSQAPWDRGDWQLRQLLAGYCAAASAVRFLNAGAWLSWRCSPHREAIDWRCCGQHGAWGSNLATGNSVSSGHGFLWKTMGLFPIFPLSVCT